MIIYKSQFKEIYTMTAIEVAERVLTGPLYEANLKYCFLDKNKVPHVSLNKCASPSNWNDFVDIETIVMSKDIDKFPVIGISVQASQLSGVDIDHCFAKPFDDSSINELGASIIKMFKDWAYIEFSFSGTGLRILFREPTIEKDEYESKYYTKNSNIHVEYYQPNGSNRCLTITGISLYPNKIDSGSTHTNIINMFLDTYMKRKNTIENSIDRDAINFVDSRDIKLLENYLKNYMISDLNLSNLWFTRAPGSNSNESERDFWLCKFIYTKITKDKDKIRELFERSPYFKSKDKKHVYKWEYRNHRYFYECIYKSLVSGR